LNSETFYQAIAEMVEPRSRVLDLGCGDGSLLKLLIERKKVTGLGVEISEECVQECIAKGLSVIHGNVDEGLVDFSDQSFDYVILNQTIQVLHNPLLALQDAVRVGRRVIVSFPNFAHWRIRWQILAKGRMPKTGTLPYEWYDTPNIHLMTIKDFEDLVLRSNMRILGRRFYGGAGMLVARLPNLLAESAIYTIASELVVSKERLDVEKPATFADSYLK